MTDGVVSARIPEKVVLQIGEGGRTHEYCFDDFIDNPGRYIELVRACMKPVRTLG